MEFENVCATAPGCCCGEAGGRPKFSGQAKGACFVADMTVAAHDCARVFVGCCVRLMSETVLVLVYLPNRRTSPAVPKSLGGSDVKVTEGFNRVVDALGEAGGEMLALLSWITDCEAILSEETWLANLFTEVLTEAVPSKVTVGGGGATFWVETLLVNLLTGVLSGGPRGFC